MRFFDEFPVMLLNSQWNDTGTGTQTEDRVYVVQTAQKVIERCLLISEDPFTGSSAYVVAQGNTALKNRWVPLVRSASLMTCELLVSVRLVSAIQLIGEPKLFA